MIEDKRLHENSQNASGHNICHHSLIHTVQVMMKVGLHMMRLFSRKYQNHFLRIPLSYVAKCPVATSSFLVEKSSVLFHWLKIELNEKS